MEKDRKRQKREDVNSHRESGEEGEGFGNEHASTGFHDLLKDAGLTFMPGNSARTISSIFVCTFVELCTR
jgi:hypothetical protein